MHFFPKIYQIKNKNYLEWINFQRGLIYLLILLSLSVKTLVMGRRRPWLVEVGGCSELKTKIGGKIYKFKEFALERQVLGAKAYHTGVDAPDSECMFSISEIICHLLVIDLVNFDKLYLYALAYFKISATNSCMPTYYIR